jgi:hypothetical protein
MVITTGVNEAYFEPFFYHLLNGSKRKVLAAIAWPKIKPRTFGIRITNFNHGTAAFGFCS